jgi:hypothetical protein
MYLAIVIKVNCEIKNVKILIKKEDNLQWLMHFWLSI